jgi:hypothetical protein
MSVRVACLWEFGSREFKPGIIWIFGYLKEGRFDRDKKNRKRYSSVPPDFASCLYCNDSSASAPRHFPHADDHVCKAIAAFA